MNIRYFGWQMNYQTIIKVEWFSYYFAIVVWCSLAIGIILSAITKRWTLLRRLIKYAVNSLVFLVAAMFVFKFGMVVRPPVTGRDEKETIANLDKWIIQESLPNLWVALAVAGLLFGFNYLLYRTVDKRRYKADLFILLAFDLIILLVVGIIVGMCEAHFGLIEEIKRDFYYMHHPLR